jgi:hypothetical protein
MKREAARVGRYFELADDMDIQGRWLLGKPMDAQGKRMDPWQFSRGRSMDVPGDMRLRLRLPGSPLDYSEASFAIPVVSRKLMELLQRLGVKEVQFFPVHVESQEAPCFVLNVTRLVDCIDESRCRTERWKPEDGAPERVGEYRLVEGLRIDPNKVGDARLFRTWGWPVLVVSEDVKEAMEREGITGTRFTEV